jgi:hypothetical protein
METKKTTHADAAPMMPRYSLSGPTWAMKIILQVTQVRPLTIHAKIFELVLVTQSFESLENEKKY